VTFFVFYKNGEQEGKTGPLWGVGTSGRERKECRRVYTYMKMEK
jgi:hypothetical protein